MKSTYCSSEVQTLASVISHARNPREGAADAQHQAKIQTTSFLTATTLIYAIGAGITAAAGTRLALQWFLEWRFNSLSFQLPD
jgi:hypothetical protein